MVLSCPWIFASILIVIFFSCLSLPTFAQRDLSTSPSRSEDVIFHRHDSKASRSASRQRASPAQQRIRPTSDERQSLSQCSQRHTSERSSIACANNARRRSLASRTFIRLVARLRHPLTSVNNRRCFAAPLIPSCVNERTKAAPHCRDSPLASFLQRLRMVHVKCRNAAYPREAGVVRATVPDDKVAWATPMPDYKPLVFTAESVLKGPVWADVDLLTTKGDLKFNHIDGKVDRRSFTGEYAVQDGLPLNPMGRTGIRGRGLLGRWGPNHAADPIVTRWKRNDDGSIVEKDGKRVLQFVSIQRGDTKEWALPGGMVDPGEETSVTLKREFSEEAMNGLTLTPEERTALDAKVSASFKSGQEVFRGYVDDPRNTDNAWMETVAVNFHDDVGDGLARFALHAGDDAVGVRWTDIDSGLSLYASHRDFVERTARMRDAHW